VQTSVLNLGLPETFNQHGGRADMLHEAGLDCEGIVAAVEMFRARHKGFAAQA
jgi:deoxyxylulose-5-phosphate synthase